MNQIKADIQIVDQIVRSIESDGCNEKYLRGQAGYHLQQAAEKMIKIQIYSNLTSVNYGKMYDHHLDNLINYGKSEGIELIIPNEIIRNSIRISEWEANGRYDLHVVTKMTTIRKYYTIITDWFDELYKFGYR